MILIVSIPRLLSTTGRYRRRTLLVGTTRVYAARCRDTLNRLAIWLVTWHYGSSKTGRTRGLASSNPALPQSALPERG